MPRSLPTPLVCTVLSTLCDLGLWLLVISPPGPHTFLFQVQVLDDQEDT